MKILRRAIFCIILQPKKYIIIKLLQFMKAKFLNMLIGVLMLTAMAACSDKEDPADIPGDYSLKVKVNCTASDKNDSPSQMMIAGYSEGQEPFDILPGTSLEKEFEIALPEVPSKAGFVVFPSIAEEGGKCEFTVKGEVTLMKGGKAISTKKFDENHSVTDVDNEDAVSYLYEVTQRGLERVDGITDPEPDLAEIFENTEKEEYLMKDNDITNKVTPYYAYFEFEQDIPARDYRDKKRKPVPKPDELQKNLYDVRNFIYNVFDKSSGYNYYYIEQVIETACSPMYAGVYSKAFKTRSGKTIGKVCEWFCDSVNIVTHPKTGTIIENDFTSKVALPPTIEKSSHKTEGFSWGLGAEVGFSADGGASAKATGSFQVSKSFDYTVYDVEITNKSGTNRTFSWGYKLASPVVSYGPVSTALTNIYPGAKVGHGTMYKNTAFLFRTKSVNPKIKVSLEVFLKSMGGKGGYPCGIQTKSKCDSLIIALPYGVLENGKVVFQNPDGLNFAK